MKMQTACLLLEFDSQKHEAQKEIVFWKPYEEERTTTPERHSTNELVCMGGNVFQTGHKVRSGWKPELKVREHQNSSILVDRSKQLVRATMIQHLAFVCDIGLHVKQVIEQKKSEIDIIKA